MSEPGQIRHEDCNGRTDCVDIVRVAIPYNRYGYVCPLLRGVANSSEGQSDYWLLADQCLDSRILGIRRGLASGGRSDSVY